MKSKIVRFLPYFALIVAIVLFLILVLVNISYPIWFDEGYSAYLIKGNFGEIWHLTSLDVHPPFYYFLLKIWSLIFGDGLIALRLMSVFFGAVSLVLLFFLLKHWFGQKPAAFATLLSALSPFLIRYGMEMRMYMVILTIVLSATFLLTLAIEKKQKIYWILYAFFVALGMYTHYFTFLVWLAQLFYLVFVLKLPVFKSPIIPVYLGAILLFLPWVPSLLSQMNAISGGFWIPEVTAVTPLSFLSSVFIFTEAKNVTGFLLLLFFLFLATYFFIIKKAYQKTEKNARKSFTFLGILVALPPLFLILVSIIYKPMFVDRYLVPSSILIWSLLGVSLVIIISKIGKNLRALIIASILIIVSSLCFSISKVLTREPESYVQNIVSLVQHSADSAPILASDIWVFFSANIYSTKATPVFGTIDSTFTNGWGAEEPMKYYVDHLPRLESGVYQTLDDFLAENPTFWYITENPDSLPVSDFSVTASIKTEHFTALKLEALD
ncbi:glycosyltransferase family 39 protein [Candidatus Saccharibacteria bacterium]|nr:glycosyltransferase family 39 protein [Candidatus Saccharibacteria bacterium]